MGTTSTLWLLIAGLVVLLIVGWALLRSGSKTTQATNYRSITAASGPISKPEPRIDWSAFRPLSADSHRVPAGSPSAPAAENAPSARSYPIEDTGIVGDKRPLPPPPMPTIEQLAPYLKSIKDRPEAATSHQVKAVEGLGLFGDVTQLTNGQASAILSARSYMKGVMHELSGGVSEGYPNEELIDANIVVYMLKDKELRKRIIEWNNRSYSRIFGQQRRRCKA